MESEKNKSPEVSHKDRTIKVWEQMRYIHEQHEKRASHIYPNQIYGYEGKKIACVFAFTEIEAIQEAFKGRDVSEFLSITQTSEYQELIKNGVAVLTVAENREGDTERRRHYILNREGSRGIQSHVIEEEYNTSQGGETAIALPDLIQPVDYYLSNFRSFTDITTNQLDEVEVYLEKVSNTIEIISEQTMY